MKKRISLFAIAFATLFSFIIGPQVQALGDPSSGPGASFCNDEKLYAAWLEQASRDEVVFYDPCDSTCSVTNSTVGSLTGADNREKIYNYLIARGLSPEQASGVTGNIQSESGFSPTRQETSQTFPAGGWGIVQWTGNRRKDEATHKRGIYDYLSVKAPDLLEKYYKAEYGGGVNEANGFVPKGVPVEDNDKLLLLELDFLYQESTGRTVNPAHLDKIPGAAAGDNEWETLKKQTTVKGASNLWVYSFEIPGNIDTTAVARVRNGDTIHEKYAGKGSGSSNGQCDSISGTIREKVVKIAEREYAAWQDGSKGVAPKNSYLEYTYGIDGEWCAWFVSWVYKEAGYPVNGNAKPYYSYVSELMDLGKKGGKFEWHLNDGAYTPQPGDIAIYGTSSNQYHTNIVLSASSPTVMTTIGGNEGNIKANNKSLVKKSDNSTYWPKEAYGYVSPTAKEGV